MLLTKITTQQQKIFEKKQTVQKRKVLRITIENNDEHKKQNRFCKHTHIHIQIKQQQKKLQGKIKAQQTKNPF